jgi:hypothetical protein
MICNKRNSAAMVDDLLNVSGQTGDDDGIDHCARAAHDRLSIVILKIQSQIAMQDHPSHCQKFRVFTACRATLIGAQ